MRIESDFNGYNKYSDNERNKNRKKQFVCFRESNQKHFLVFKLSIESNCYKLHHTVLIMLSIA